jgi:GTPase SAR1 family protein
VDPDFVPNDQDILRARAMTTGITEIDFTVEETKFRVIDVGGQRSERRKWIHCFNEVTAVLFCVALSEYDQKIREDNETNRFLEALNLFKEICNNTFFTNTSMILFLNKSDLFREKIKKVDLKISFPDYKGGLNFDEATTFILDKFASVNENPEKEIYTHITCATDSSNVKFVFSSVKVILLQNFCANMGF